MNVYKKGNCNHCGRPFKYLVKPPVKCRSCGHDPMEEIPPPTDQDIPEDTPSHYRYKPKWIPKPKPPLGKRVKLSSDPGVRKKIELPPELKAKVAKAIREVKNPGLETDIYGNPLDSSED